METIYEVSVMTNQMGNHTALIKDKDSIHKLFEDNPTRVSPRQQELVIDAIKKLMDWGTPGHETMVAPSYMELRIGSWAFIINVKPKKLL